MTRSSVTTYGVTYDISFTANPGDITTLQVVTMQAIEGSTVVLLSDGSSAVTVASVSEKVKAVIPGTARYMDVKTPALCNRTSVHAYFFDVCIFWCCWHW